MERQPQARIAEPEIADSAGGRALRTTLYGGLAVLLLAGAWVRFNREIAAVLPGLAEPAAGVAEAAAESGRVTGLVELALLPDSAAAAAVAAMGLPDRDAAALIQAVRDRRLRLVRLPLFDPGPVAFAAQRGVHAIEISSGGYTRILELASEPRSVTLPVGPVATVTFRNLSGEATGIGALTLAGPVRLPDLPRGGTMDVGVIAQ
jgi:hypothetical protein